MIAFAVMDPHRFAEGATTPDDPREFVTARVFDAPREAVYQAFADPMRLARWWGPNGYTNTLREFDLRPGGAFALVMHAPDGSDYEVRHEFVAVETDRIVYRHPTGTHAFSMTMRFTAHGAGTLLTWRMRFDHREEADRLRAFIPDANEQNFDRLAAHLATERR